MHIAVAVVGMVSLFVSATISMLGEEEDRMSALHSLHGSDGEFERVLNPVVGAVVSITTLVIALVCLVVFLTGI